MTTGLLKLSPPALVVTTRLRKSDPSMPNCTIPGTAIIGFCLTITLFQKLASYLLIIMSFKLNRIGRITVLVTVVAALSACVTYAPSQAFIGKSRPEVISLMGQPAREVPLEEGSRLVYPRGPHGRHTYFIELDAAGRVQRWEQVLTEKNFSLITSGMRTDEVLARIGESRAQFGLARERGFVWNYRYVTPFCQWFQIEFDKDGIVRSTGYGPSPECRRARPVR